MASCGAPVAGWGCGQGSLACRKLLYGPGPLVVGFPALATLETQLMLMSVARAPQMTPCPTLPSSVRGAMAKVSMSFQELK